MILIKITKTQKYVQHLHGYLEKEAASVGKIIIFPSFKISNNIGDGIRFDDDD